MGDKFILTKNDSGANVLEAALRWRSSSAMQSGTRRPTWRGMTPAVKICILASLAYGKHVYPDQVHTEGITKLTLEDVEYAESWGGVIKLIGRVKRDEKKKLQIIVCPMFIPRESQLANVDDVFNGNFGSRGFHG